MRNPVIHCLFLGALLTMSTVVHAQAPAAAPADVGTIADIMRVSYEVISGPAGAPRQWERDRTLYMPGATFVVTNKRDGKVETTIMTPEEYRRKSDATFVAQGLFETEIGSRVERFGNVAQVRSVSVSRQAGRSHRIPLRELRSSLLGRRPVVDRRRGVEIESAGRSDPGGVVDPLGEAFRVVETREC